MRRWPALGGLVLLVALASGCGTADDATGHAVLGTPPELAPPDPTTTVTTASTVTSTTVTTTVTSTTVTPATAVTVPPAPAPAPARVVRSSRTTADGNTSWPLPRPWPEQFVVAHATRSRISIRSSADGPEVRTLADPTPEGLPLVFLVRNGSPDGRWLHVQLPGRPNGSMGWVRRADVSLTQVGRHVVVHLEANRMTVYEGERAIIDLPVSVGAPSSPTPPGTFYVDGLRRVRGRQDGPYGPFQISFTGYSTVYSHFAGGIGQVAFHGTNRPDLIGRSVSNGCVRLANGDIRELSRLIPVGAPVEVVA